MLALMNALAALFLWRSGKSVLLFRFLGIYPVTDRKSVV